MIEQRSKPGVEVGTHSAFQGTVDNVGSEGATNI